MGTEKTDGWNPISTAPDFERILVCGWQPRHGNVEGYWWWHEDVAFEGRATGHPTAQFWTKIILPDFPADAMLRARESQS